MTDRKNLFRGIIGGNFMKTQKIKEVLGKKMNSAWVWIIAITSGAFIFITFNYMFEPKFMPQPIVDFSKDVINGLILGE